jgi:hypothetical protein
MMPFRPVDQYRQPPAFSRGPELQPVLQHTQIVIYDSGAENSDWQNHHYGERNENSYCCDGLDTDLASDHTHEGAQTDEAELADENHPEDMLDPDGYDEVDHVDEPVDMPGAAMQTAMRIIQRCWTSHLQTMIGILWTMVKRTIVVMQATRIIMTMMATKPRTLIQIMAQTTRMGTALMAMITVSHMTHTTRTMTAMGMTTRSLQMDIMTR